MPTFVHVLAFTKPFCSHHGFCVSLLSDSRQNQLMIWVTSAAP